MNGDGTPTPVPASTIAPLKVAFLGDSYMSGAATSAPEQRWTARLSAANGWAEINAGVGATGYATAGGEPNARPYAERTVDIVAAAPDVVIVSGGRFDYLGSSSVTTVSAAIVATFSELRAGLPQAKIIAISPLWGTSEPPTRLAEIGTEVRAAVEAAGGSYVDILQPLEARTHVLAADGVSPNDAGHAILLEAIRPSVESLVNATP
ncbi:lysophospholipase L1-like esterase [Okibacterium sp. HSC-33S16]|uniref:SGNH/GDSL hydrolase family protein n=1 Tax=Okibacterium sp. HSC-33S16 TaxID=2910965 RepID=UPI00209F1563|nr:SGNH/GDSL hydrolase family protein [Okibacterium sp. HSC-33S16]MCP2032144.1 lysophospholipase L1-like esterase [Okibacterium sp. HSC-33S16]